MIGKTVSHYRILEKIGAGGMGVVYKAEDILLHRVVALKFLHATDDLPRLLREARVAASLNHPNVCTVYEVNPEHGFLVMEFVEGESLATKIGGRPLPVEDSVEFAAQICEGLRAAHLKGIVHRDVKSGNVLVTVDGQAKILDFGLARMPGQMTLTRQGVAAGTPGYMAPEQMRGEAADRRTDIWALGAVLHEMLTGRVPMGQTEALPEGLSLIVRKALAADPRERYQHADDLLVDLRALGRRRRGVPTLVSGRASRRRLLKVGGATGGLGIVLAGYEVFRRVRQSATVAIGPQIRSIAVLPLRNASGAPAQEYFSDGMTESLIASLAKVGSIKVIARNSVMRYKSSDKPLPDIAAELGVTGILEGSVQRVSGRVLIDVTLFDAKTGLSIWGQSYDRELADALILQSNISRDIARQIHVELTPREEARLDTARRVDPEAHDLYIRGLSYMTQLTAPGLDTAMRYFVQAREKDPALGWAGIAFVWLTRMQFGFTPASEAAPQAKAAALEALKRDDNLPEIHLVLAVVKQRVDWDWEGARREFERALELNPNDAETCAQYATLEQALGNPNRALELGARALELEPFRPIFQGMHAMALSNAGRYEEALSLIDQVIQQQPSLKQTALQARCNALYGLHRYEDLFQAIRSSFEAKGDLEVVRALDRGHAESGYQRGLQLGADTLAQRVKKDPADPAIIEAMYHYAGNQERTMDWIEYMFKQRDPNMQGMVNLSRAGDLRDNPRFQAIRKSMGLPSL